jgi:hypothetical protein
VSAPPPVPQLRPLALGELIDRSATFWRAHLRPLFLLCLGFELVNYILGKGVLLVLHRHTSVLQGGAALQGRSQDEVLGEAGVALLAAGVLLAVLIWSYWLAVIAVTRYVMPLQLGEPARPMDGLRRGLRQLGTLTATYALSLLWSLGITVLLVLPGGALVGLGALALSRGDSSLTSVVGGVFAIGGALLALLGAVAAFLWYLLRFALLAPVLAMEDLPALRAFRRSGELVSGRVGPGFLGRVKVRAMVLITVVSGILVVVSTVSGLPVWIVRFAYGSPLDPTTEAAIPQTLLVPLELLQVVAQSVVTPLALVFYAMFYLDMRMRREGLDLERRLDARLARAA